MNVRSFLAVLGLLLPIAAQAQMGLPDNIGATFVPVAAPTTCTKPGFVDGCPGAPAGAPQLSTILSSYAAPPPWNVAGVDYATGFPNGTALADPATISIAGVTVNAGAHTVTISGNNVTLTGYDFGLANGWTITVNGANDTIQASRLKVGTNQGALGNILNVTSSASNFSLLTSEVDGNNIAVTSQAGQTINVSSGGSITIQYCYLHNSGGDMIDFNAVPSAITSVIRYNLFRDIGVNTAHADPVQFAGTNVASSLMEFNTAYQSGNWQNGNGLLMNGPSEGSTSNIRNATTRNNTLISLAACNTCNWAVGYYQDTSGVGSNIAIYANYVDPTGINLFTGSPWQSPNKTGSGGFTGNITTPAAYYGLTNMVNGAAIPVPTRTAATSQGYYVYPDAANLSPSLSAIYTMTPSPASGNVVTGSTVTISLAMVAPATVTGTPTLTLNDGGTASYVSGSGTNTLVFSHTVAAGNSAATLAVTAVNGTIKDDVGNTLALSPLTNIVTSFAGLSVNNGVGNTLAFTTLNGGLVSSVTTGSGTYTGSTPSGLVSPVTFGGGCTGSSTVTGFGIPSAGSWNATFSTPATPCTGTIVSVTGTGSNTSTSGPSPSATFATAGSCPDDDGFAGATPGAANYPTMLNAYTTRINGTNGLGCKVAGVDYRVGTSATQVFKVFGTNALPAGASINGNLIEISGNNVVMDGWDFTGKEAHITGNSPTITNSKFSMQTPACLPEIFWDNFAGVNTVTHNSFDEHADTGCTSIQPPAGFSAAIYMNVKPAQGASLVFEYNDEERIISDAIGIVGTNGGVGLAVTHKFNLIRQMGYNNGAHADGWQFSQGTVNGPIFSHNTFYNDIMQNNPPQPVHTEAQGSGFGTAGIIINARITYNTIVTNGSCTNYPTGCTANMDIACKSDGGSNSNTGFQAYGNYIDGRGAIPGSILSKGACPSTIWGTPQSNWDMPNNVTLTTNPPS